MPRRWTKPEGYRDGNSRLRVSISFDDQQFNALCTIMKREGISFAETARMVVEWGLESQGDRT